MYGYFYPQINKELNQNKETLIFNNFNQIEPNNEGYTSSGVGYQNKWVTMQIGNGSENWSAGDEIQLTDAISLSAKHESVFSFKFSGTRYDCGSKLCFLRAQIASALTDPELKKDIRKELKKF